HERDAGLPDRLSLQRELVKVEVVALDRGFYALCAPIVSARCGNGFTKLVKRKQRTVSFHDGIEEVRHLFIDIPVGATRGVRRWQWEERAFLVVTSSPTYTQVLPGEAEPPVALPFAPIQVLCTGLRSEMLHIPILEAILRFREPALLM